MFSFFKNIFPAPKKFKKCIRKINKDDGDYSKEIPCREDIWPEPEIEIVDGENMLVYYCAKHREHKYTEEEYKNVPST